MKKILIILISLVVILPVQAQVSISTTTDNPDPSAMLDVQSTNKGLLPPRLSDTNQVSNPAAGLLIYDLSTHCMRYYNGTQWSDCMGCNNSGSGSGSSNANYTIGTGGSCANTSVNGTYTEGVALDGSNTVTMDVNVTSTGTWSINTDTINGYSFSGSGTFTSTGTVQVTLDGSGTPAAAQTDNFTATADNGGGTCTFDVTVNAAAFSCGNQLTDSRDNQTYNTVQLGSQCWMAENLNIGTMINNSNDQTNNSTIEKYCYNNDATNCDTYGGLYQWNEAMDYTTTAGAQGICPSGWHLPTDDEWKTLEMQLGMSQTQADNQGWRGTDEGSKMAGNEPLWNNGNLDQNANFGSSGLTVLPGGYRHSNSAFYNKDENAYMWTSSMSGSDSWYRGLYYDYTSVNRHDLLRDSGLSIRCVKD